MQTKTDVANWYSGKRVLVTGAAGFVGRALARALYANGARVWVIVRDTDKVTPFHSWDIWPQYIESTITGDLTDYNLVERAIAESEPEIVFHLAAMSQVKHNRIAPRQAYRNNTMGTVNLLEGVRLLAPDAGVVIASSDKAFGEPLETPLRDNTPINPIHPYDASKAAADIAAQSYGRYYNIKVGITRCGNIYGPGDCNWQRLIPGVLRDLICRRAPIIRSDGKSVRDYNYIDDIVDAYLRVGIGMLQPLFFGPRIFTPGQTWLVASGYSLSVLDIVNLCRMALPEGLQIEPIIEGSAVDETKALVLDGSKFDKSFNWNERTTIESGIQVTAEWLVEYLPHGEVIVL
jgi:CDP-glucose 4,6-dehydratase